MEGEFISEGKTYISASRASKLYGYTADYIGQLCRKAAIECRRVGRVWFVDQESLQKHKDAASVAPRGRIPSSEKIYEQTTDAKEVAYLPLSKAAKISGYSQDYIGQLCRKGVVESRRVGRAWFVSEVSLLKHKEGASVAPRGRIEIYQGPAEIEKVAEAAALSDEPVAVSTAAILTQKVLPSHFSVARKAAVGFLVVVILFATHIATQKIPAVNSLSKVASDVAENSAASIMSVPEFIFYKISGFFSGTTNKIRLAFGGQTKPGVVLDNGSTQDLGAAANLTSPQAGVAVLPSAGDPTVNEQVKKYVTNSFSDETQIVPDKSGNSGLLKPVFKENKNQEYLYVVVPVKDKATAAAPNDSSVTQQSSQQNN